LTAEQKLQLQSSVADARVQLLTEIRATDANERATLDKLILFVGGYSAILGLMAFGTVNLVRRDAEEQMARIEKNLVKFEDQTKKSLEDLTEDTEKKLVKFQDEIWKELPQMRNLQKRLDDLLRELAQTVPSESDRTSRSSYRNLSEKRDRKSWSANIRSVRCETLFRPIPSPGQLWQGFTGHWRVFTLAATSRMREPETQNVRIYMRWSHWRSSQTTPGSTA
jgi:hypothetical protein